MISNYVLYNPSTGEIQQSGYSPVGMETQLQGLSLLRLASESEVSMLTHHVVDGALVAYSPAQQAEKARQPRGAWAWSNQEMAWQDLRSLDEKRAAKWAEIKAARDAAEFGGFSVNGWVYDSDAISQSRIQGAVQLAGLAKAANGPFFINWTLANNSVTSLDTDGMLAVGTALAQHVSSVHNKARNLRMRINGASTPAELDSVSW
jgi:hypothetical protein